MPLIVVRPITSSHESFTGQSHWLGLPAERLKAKSRHAVKRVG